MLALMLCATGHATQFNGTTYWLDEWTATVHLPVNASSLNLTLSWRAEDILLTDAAGGNVSFNSTYSFWRGSHIYSLSFDRHVSGELVYKIPLQGQQFILPIRDGGPVRIVLPEGYTTGNRILGIPRPSPDEFRAGEAGDVLTWYNTSQVPYIEVGYYLKSAPDVMGKIFALLALCAAAVLAEYYISIRRLRSLRREEGRP